MPYMIDRPDPDEQFINDRELALKYIDKISLKSEGLTGFFTKKHKNFRWIKTEPSYPSFEDFTFGFRNQIFPVLVIRANERGMLLNPPPRIEALRRECSRNNLIPCVFPIFYRTGQPFFNGEWNLINPFTGKKIDPVKMSSNEPVEISDWELRNWAVKVVWDYLKQEGLERLSFCDAPEIDPQIWFRDKDGKECWLEVLYAPYPVDTQSLNFSFANWPDQVLSHRGYCAKVGFADNELTGRLYRNQGAFINFRGIQQVHTPQ